MLRQKRFATLTLMLIFMLAVGVSQVVAQGGVNIYGYFSLNYEDVGDQPDGANDPGEFTFPHFNLMLQSRLSDSFRVYSNLAGDDAEEITVRNYWGEYVIRDYLKIRAGKIYRPFGLFNEKLDAVPTYLGIEPPELFDKDHLMLPRTNQLMVHGNIPVGANMLRYALMTGNKEVIDTGKPLSWDLRYTVDTRFTVGTSGYYSNELGAPLAVGDGSPRGGVLPWMAEDKYVVYGAYAQAQLGNVAVKAAYWRADHDAVRDAESVIALDDLTQLNATQRERFGLDKHDLSDNIGDIVTDVSYAVSTYYIRLGYTIPGETIPGISWDITPFAFWDFYENPETIAKKTYGGDNEAGLADDGKFAKPTIGVTIKPSSQVAFKIDASSHIYKWSEPGAESETVHYEEIRFDLSYFFR